MAELINEAYGRRTHLERSGELPDGLDGALAAVNKLDFSFHPLSLRFRDAELEEAYSIQNYERQIGLTRFSIVMGAAKRAWDRFGGK